MSGNITVKVSTAFPEWPLSRQTPESSGVWGNCVFVIDRDVKECDYWIVYEGLTHTQRALCPPENTLLITGEPPSVKTYNSKFIRQFFTVLTCHQDISHPHIIYKQQGLPWHIGKIYKNSNIGGFRRNYDELKSIRSFDKHRLLSVISSNKDWTEGHRNRLDFVRKLTDYFGKDIDVFGKGIRDIEDKWDAIADYKYHIVLENGSYIDYWTEKLSDTYLAGAFPIYYGCPNLSDYFAPAAYAPIDINNVDAALAIVKSTIAHERYEKAIGDLDQARSLVLDKYNFFPMVHDFIVSREMKRNKEWITLQPELFLSDSPIKNMFRRFRSAFLR